MYTGQTMYTLPRRSPQQKHHFAYTEACAYWRGAVYASAQKASAKTSFCVYRSRRVCEGQCVRICAESFSENIILRIQKLRRLRGELYTLLLRSFERKHVHWADNVYASAQKLQQKHHFAYTEAGASARGNVYASVQKASAKTSFCVYRCWGVLEGSCIRFCLGALSESMYTGQTMYTLLRRKLQRKHHFAYTEAGASARGNVYASVQKASAKTSFCVYRSWGICEGQCVRICAESSQRKHDFAYTNTGASARGDVYAFMQKPSVKTSFCVYRSWGVCERRCIRFCAKLAAKAPFCVYRS